MVKLEIEGYFTAPIDLTLKVDSDYRRYEETIGEMKAIEQDMAATFIEKVERKTERLKRVMAPPRKLSRKVKSIAMGDERALRFQQELPRFLIHYSRGSKDLGNACTPRDSYLSTLAHASHGDTSDRNQFGPLTI